MRAWLRATHGPTFELLRHFLRRCFDSEFITTPGHMATVLIGTVPVFCQWFFLLIGPLRKKYEALSRLPDPSLFREAVRSDELWLITLMMSAIGLLTAMRWHALFPDALDYRALGSLPLHPARIFAAKFAALMLMAVGALAVVNTLPCIIFPALSGGRWALQPSVVDRAVAHAGASLAASAFAFFALVALQGLLLNTLRPRTFARASGYCQGLLVAFLLGVLILSFSIQPQLTAVVTRPPWAAWLPPVWFLGLHQALSGDPDPAARLLAGRAGHALLVAVVLAMAAYLISYHRHRLLFMEGMSGRARESRWSRALAGLLAQTPRQRAVMGFMLDTVTRSRHHRMVLMGYGGLAFALLLTGLAGIGQTVEPAGALLAGFVYYHMLALLLLLIGARHVFALPTEWKANWIFQITGAEGRIEWLSCVDRFVYFWGALLVLTLPAPFEIWLLGMRGAAGVLLFAVLGLLAYEWAFSSWDRVPFTCSYLPGQVPVWMILAFFGLLGVLSLAHALLVAVLSDVLSFVYTFAAIVAVWLRKRAARRESWTYLRLRYDDTPEPAVQSLELLR